MKEWSEFDKCFNMLNMVLDAEATEKQKVHLITHIDTCLSCLRDYNLEKVIKELLQSRCSKSEVPAGLAEAIKTKLSKKTL